MVLTRESLITKIVEDSLFLDERIRIYKSGSWIKADQTVINTTFWRKKWQSVFSNQPGHSFKKRLEWAEINIEDLKNIANLRPVQYENPAWADLFLELVVEFEDSYKYPADTTKKDYSKLLADSVGNFIIGWSTNLVLGLISFPHNNLERDIFIDISGWFNSLFRDSLQEAIFQIVQIGDDSFFIDFESQSSSDQFFGQICVRNPVFARLLSQKILDWKRDYERFFSRLEKDYDKLVNLFEIPRDKTQLQEIQRNLSDPHEFGQSVCLLHFKDHSRILYKPKELEAEIIFYNFTSWLKTQGFHASPKAPKILQQDKYGWVEYIEHQPTTITPDIKLFYYNSGIFLCLLHILKATDCHYENIVSNSNTPFLVDSETILQPAVSLADNYESNRIINKTFMQSCLRTGFLPAWTAHHNDSVICDISGLGGLRLIRMISDKRKGTTYEIPSFTLKNQPTEGKINFESYKKEILEGFQELYGFFIENKMSLSTKSPLITSSCIRTRYVYRATEVYQRIIDHAIKAENLSHGLLFSASLDLLARAHIKESGADNFSSILEHELSSVHRLDIPVFYARTDSDHLYISEGVHIPFFEKSGLELVKQGLKELNRESLAYELNILEGSIIAAELESGSGTYRDELTLLNSGNRSLNLSYAQLAENIAQEILNLRTETKEKYDWLCLSFSQRTGRYQFGPVGFGLYDGRVGISLFLAALFNTTGKKTYADHADKCLEPVLQVLQTSNEHEFSSIVYSVGLGGVAGVGSLIYSLAEISKYTGKYFYKYVALKTAQKITSQMIRSDLFNDVVSGNAGLILSLLNLYKLEANQVLLDLSIQSGNKLVELIHKGIIDLDISSSKSRFLTGFSHGAGGIGYSLIRLYRSTGESKFLEMGLKCINYEISHFDAKTISYSDFRHGENSNTPPNSWCHGVSGILQSRLHILEELRKSEYSSEEIDLGIEHLIDSDNFGVDHLCCGNSGRIDALLSAGIALDRPELIELAENRIKRMLFEASEKNGFRLNAQISSGFVNVGFFQGLSGIGYELLRINNPNNINAVLMFD